MMFLSPYQEDLVTPGSLPSRASSRKVMRERPNLRMKPRGRPVMEQRLRTRILEALRGMAQSLALGGKEFLVGCAGIGEHLFKFRLLGRVLLNQFLALDVALYR